MEQEIFIGFCETKEINANFIQIPRKFSDEGFAAYGANGAGY